MLGLLHLVFVEGFLAHDHLLVKAGGMEQVEATVLPKSDADVACVKTVRVGEHCHDVTIFHCAQCRALLPCKVLLGDVAELPSISCLFVCLDGGHEVGMVLQLLVQRGVGGHIVDVHGLHGCESTQCMGRGMPLCLHLRGDVMHDAELLVVFCPPCEVVETGSVVGHFSLAETDASEVLTEVVESEPVLLVAEGECQDRFDECRAI